MAADYWWWDWSPEAYDRFDNRYDAPPVYDPWAEFPPGTPPPPSTRPPAAPLPQALPPDLPPLPPAPTSGGTTPYGDIYDILDLPQNTNTGGGTPSGGTPAAALPPPSPGQVAALPPPTAVAPPPTALPPPTAAPPTAALPPPVVPPPATTALPPPTAAPPPTANDLQTIDPESIPDPITNLPTGTVPAPDPTLTASPNPLGPAAEGVLSGENALGSGTPNAAGGGEDIPWWVLLGFDTLQAYLASNAIGDAGDASIAGDQAAIDEIGRQFDITRDDLAPYRNVGSQAINTLGSIYGYGPDGQPLGIDTPDYSEFYKSPDYNFRRTEGTRDIGSLFSSRGSALSGNALKALTDYSSNLAAGEFGNYFNRQGALAGIGQTATNTGAQVGLTSSLATGNALISQGNTRASGVLGQSNIWNSVINNALDNYYSR